MESGNVKHPFSVGFILILLTLATKYVSGMDQGTVIQGANMVGIIVLIVAYVKVYIIASHFMEMRRAVLWARSLANIWLACTFCLLSLAYTGAI